MLFDNNTQIVCDTCQRHVQTGTHWHCNSCLNGQFDFCPDCRDQGRKCPCGGFNAIMLQILPGVGRQRVDPSNFPGDSVNAIECDLCRVHLHGGTHWLCLKCYLGDFSLCEPCYARGGRCPCGGATTMAHLQIIQGEGRSLVNPQTLAPYSSHAATSLPFTTPLAPAFAPTISYGMTPSLPSPTPAMKPVMQPMAAPMAALPSGPMGGAMPGHEVTAGLARLLPPSFQVHRASENTRIVSLYNEAHRVAGTSLPHMQISFINDKAAFGRWVQSTYHPRRNQCQSVLSSLQTCKTTLVNHADHNVAVGQAAWNFITPSMEMGDILDLLIVVERKMEETYQDIKTADDLKVDLEATAESSQAYSSNNWQQAQQWDSWKEHAKKQVDVAFHRSRSERKTAFTSLLQRLATKADSADRAAYETVVQELNRTLPAVATATEVDLDRLSLAFRVLGASRDMRVALIHKTFQAQTDAAGQTEYHTKAAELPSSALAQRDALLQNQKHVLDQLSRRRDQEIQAIENDYKARVEQVLLPVMKGIEDRLVGSGAMKPKANMPLSWYSNMLTQQHVTNMNVISNVAGGYTQYGLMNSTTG